MRTTVDLDDDVRSAVDQLRRDRGLGLSEVVNELATQGLGRSSSPQPYVQPTASLGMRIDVSDIGEVLELLDDIDAAQARATGRRDA